METILIYWNKEYERIGYFEDVKAETIYCIDLTNHNVLDWYYHMPYDLTKEIIKDVLNDVNGFDDIDISINYTEAIKETLEEYMDDEPVFAEFLKEKF